MAHIKLNNEELPGIIGLLDYRQETALPLSELAEVLLRGDSTLSSGEREIIASSVSYWNNCHFCHASHGASAVAHLKTDLTLIEEIENGFQNREISPKMRTLLNIAHKVQMGGKNVKEDDISRARKEGATDREIHDTVLIAAAFCMYNRYVDGLNTWSPEPLEAYKENGEMLAHEGYLAAIQTGK